MGSKVGIQYLQKILDYSTKGSGFDSMCNSVKVIAGGNGSLTALLKIEPRHLNVGGFLHGGMAALLVDTVSGVAFMTHPKVKGGGLSVSINMQYMKSVQEGEEILIKASTEKVGRRLAFLHVNIFRKTDGQIVANGTHIKVV